MESRDEILFVPHHHFDPTWRRCFDRPAIAHGQTVRSYAEVEDHVISRWLELSERGYTFSDGQAVVWRAYLRRHPERLAALKRRIDDGKLEIMLAGETVQDTNLPSAEGLVRNFLVAMPLYEQLCGLDHPGLKMAWLEDAFGNSPNYPQVLLGVGAEVACQLSYCALKEPVWVGIDGSRIACYDSAPHVFRGVYGKHPPCGECRGAGCATCNQTGMRLLDEVDLDSMRVAFREALAGQAQEGQALGAAFGEASGSAAAQRAAGTRPVMRLVVEEDLPDPRLLDLVEEFAAAPTTVRFANPGDIYRQQRTTLEKALSMRDDAPNRDLNPAMPGCYVTRIRCKQRTRAVAYELLVAEATLANSAWDDGQPHPPPADFSRAWQRVCFNQFHDAITGTHIDSAHVELMEMLDEAHAVAEPYLPAVAPRPAEHFVALDAGQTLSLKLGDIELEVDQTGIVSASLEGRDLFGGYPHYAREHRPYRLGELVMEADFGDAWGQRIAMFNDVEKADPSRIALGDFHWLVEAAERAVRWHGGYDGGDPLVRRLDWTVTLRASEDGQRLDFVTDVDWDTRSRRLRAFFPGASQSPTSRYEVPFGFIDRTFDTSKIDYTQWKSNTMEFPALHWVHHAIDESAGVALLNKGLPCTRWVPGRFDLSLLRSPEWQFCVVEPGSYEFWDIDGQRDTGHHQFEYSLWPHVRPLSSAELTRAGYAYNLPAPLVAPFSISDDAIVTAWKLAERGNGWILRVQEIAGQSSRVKIDLGREMSVTPTDLLERPQGQRQRRRSIEQTLRRHGVATVVIEP
jgi:alpha-mannosidase